jgi:hypothetical protein
MQPYTTVPAVEGNPLQLSVQVTLLGQDPSKNEYVWYEIALNDTTTESVLCEAVRCFCYRPNIFSQAELAILLYLSMRLL